MVVPFTLHAGDSVPVQQSTTTCGSASLTVARMLANPSFAAWIRSGIRPDAAPATMSAGPTTAIDPGTEAQRFAAYEQVVAARTNALFGGGWRLQLPWPRALGTPPWGARNELEFGAADQGARYSVTTVRPGSVAALGNAYDDLHTRVRAGHPALLYVGNRWLPRHVVLVMPATAGQELDVYEPSVGRVVDLPRAAFTQQRLALGGWDVPWLVISDRSDA